VVSMQTGAERSRRPKGTFVDACCQEAARRFKLSGCDVVGRRTPDSIGHGPPRTVPSPEFVQRVDALLPAQPWPPAVHVAIANELKVMPKIIQNAIQLLIASGRRHAQRDGVVYDASGNILAVDTNRSQQGDSDSPTSAP